jgi:outer membrane protein
MGKRAVPHFFKSLALAGGVAIGALVPAAHADNLTDALIGAYRTSGLLEQQRATLRAADEDVAIARSALRPTIDWITRYQQNFNRASVRGVGVSTTDQSTLQTGLSLRQLIYDGGAVKLGVQANQELVLSTRQALVSVEQRILLRAVAAYAGVLLQQENVALRQNNLRLLREELRAAQDRFEVGEVTRTDVALAESRVASAQASLTDARGALVDAKSEYANAVGHDPGTITQQPALPQRVASVAQARAVAARSHPDILSAQHAVKARELGVSAAKKALGPDVGLRGDFFLTERFSGANQGISDATVTVELTQNLYAGGRLAADVRKARANRDVARSQLLTTQRDTLQDVNDAFVSLEVAQANLVSSREQIRAAQVAFDGIREEATLGARTTLDVLQAEQELLNAQTARIQAQAERIIAAYTLLSSQGLLTAQRLGLGVQIYDPALYYNLAKEAPAYRSKQSRDLERVLEALGKK